MGDDIEKKKSDKKEVNRTNLKKVGLRKVSKEFVPTDRMLDFLKSALDPEVGTSIVAISNASGVARSRWYDWQEMEGFKEWFGNAFRAGMKHTEWYLDKIGLEMAKKDYKYFEAMQAKYHNFTSRDEGKITLEIKRSVEDKP